MRRIFALRWLFLLPLLGVPALMTAQEPVFFSGIRALRFEESPGFYHYLYPCKSPVDFHAEMPKIDPFATALEPAICWPINALKMVKVNDKYESSPAVPGQLVVAEHNIRFLPNDQKLADRYADLIPAQTRFEHTPGQNFGFFGVEGAFFKFGFSNLCPACADGTTVPPIANPAKLESEFALIADSLKHFDSILKHVQDLAASLRVEINAANQPGPADPHEAMGLYAALNDQLAKLCPEPARSCIETFARYQAACKNVVSASDCPAPPSCAAACNLSPENIRNVPAMFCTQPDQQGATAVPDWTPVLQKKRQADAPASVANAPATPATIQSGGHTIQLVPGGPLPPRQFRPGALDMQFVRNPSSPPSVGCTVKASYERASLPDAAFGVAGMNGVPGGVIGSVFNNSTPHSGSTPGASRKIAISAGIAQGNLISAVPPIYPPIAKAARVSGTVVLMATISKTGEIENLRIVSGPAMLQSAALDAVRQWSYRPYLLNGEPVEVDTTVNVVFNLGGDAPPAQAPPSAQP